MTWWPLAAAALGSATALSIAFVAYPWQKEKDRQLEIQKEKRARYADFLEKLNLLFFESDEVDAAFTEGNRPFWASYSALLVYATPSIADLAFRMLMLKLAEKLEQPMQNAAVEQFRKLGWEVDDLKTALRSTEKSLVLAMRDDAGLEPMAASHDYLRFLDRSSDLLDGKFE